MSGTYLLVGDSQAVGLEDELREAMAARGWQQVGVQARVGIGTAETALAVAALPRADLAIVVLGGNDTAGPALERAIAELVRRLPAPQVVWIGPAHAGVPEIQARKRAVAALQARVLGALRVPWIDGSAMTVDLEHAPDRVHFTRAALAVWANRIAAIDLTGGFSWQTAIAAGLALTVGAVAGFGLYRILRRGPR